MSAPFQYPTGGDLDVKEALKILNGEKVEKNIVLGSRRFDTDNVDAGGEEIK